MQPDCPTCVTAAVRRAISRSSPTIRTTFQPNWSWCKRNSTSYSLWSSYTKAWVEDGSNERDRESTGERLLGATLGPMHDDCIRVGRAGVSQDEERAIRSRSTPPALHTHTPPLPMH